MKRHFKRNNILGKISIFLVFTTLLSILLPISISESASSNNSFNENKGLLEIISSDELGDLESPDLKEDYIVKRIKIIYNAYEEELTEDNLYLNIPDQFELISTDVDNATVVDENTIEDNISGLNENVVKILAKTTNDQISIVENKSELNSNDANLIIGIPDTNKREEVDFLIYVPDKLAEKQNIMAYTDSVVSYVEIPATETIVERDFVEKENKVADSIIDINTGNDFNTITDQANDDEVVNEEVIKTRSNMDITPMAEEWDISGAVKNISFYTSINGLCVTSAEVVGNEVIWKIEISHDVIRGTTKYVQGISEGDIKISDITEMISSSKGGASVHPPKTIIAGQGLFNDNKIPYISKNPTNYVPSSADTTTFTIKQPILPGETSKTVKFRAAVIRYSTDTNSSASTPSGEIELTVTKKEPTTGNATLKINVPAGTQAPTTATASIKKSGVDSGTINLNETIALDPGTYDFTLNIPDGYELAPGETNPKSVTITAGETQDVSFNLVKLPDTGKVTVVFDYEGTATKPNNLTANATKDGSLFVLEDGVPKDIPAGVYNVVPNIPEGYEVVGESSYSLNLVKGGTATVTFRIREAVPKEGQLQFVVQVPQGTTPPTDVTATIVSGSINENEIYTLRTGYYDVVLNIPPGYQLAPGQEQSVKALVEEGQLTTVRFNLEFTGEVDTGHLTLNVNYQGDGEKPENLSAIAFHQLNNKSLTLIDGVRTKAETGRYRVTLNIPEGYEVVGPSFYIVDLAKDADLNVDFNLRKKLEPSQLGNLKITVQDSLDDNIKIIGAKFKISSGTNEYEAVTNSNGVLELKNIPVGSYKIEQLTTQNGYFVAEDIPDQDIEAGYTTVGTIKNVKNPNAGTQGPYIQVYLKDGDLNNGPAIPGAKIELKDDLGNTYYGYTDSSGSVIFDRLSRLRTYSVSAVDYPYVFGKGIRTLDSGLRFPIDPTAPPVIIVKGQLNRVEKQPIDIVVYEEGDSRITIPGAQIEITNPDGTKDIVTTDSRGRVTVLLPELFDYEFRQLSTDATHIINPEVFVRYSQRGETVEIPNKLKDPDSVRKDIKVKKVWADNPPSTSTEATIRLLANGDEVRRTTLLPDGGYTFTGLNKYDQNHAMIKYTVEEVQIDGYYATYTKNDIDGYAWTITNYEGYSEGTCSSGNFWVSTTTKAYEVTGEGVKTDRSIDLEIKGDITNYNTFGYGITVDYERNILFAMNKWGYMQLRDLTTGEKIGRDIKIGVFDRIPGTDYGNSLGISRDGSKIFAATWLTKTIYVYDTQDLINKAKAGQNTEASQTFSTTTLAGDLIELPNGDILVSGDQGHGSSQTGTGLWVHKKNADGTYSAAKQIGTIANTDGVVNTHSIEGLGFVNGEVVITRPLGSSSSRVYGVFKLSPMPSYDLPASNGDVFTATRLGNAEFNGVLADAADNANTPCTAWVKVSGSKLWENDTPENRPESITVELYANGVATGKTKLVQPDANGNWNYVFDGLDKYDSNGTAILYTVKEVSVPPGYKVSYPANSYNIINTLDPGTLYIKKIKAGSTDALTGAEFTLYKEDKETVLFGPVQVDENGDLKIENIPQGTYYLKETKAPEGYILDTEYYKVTVENVSGKIVVKIYSEKNPNGVVVNEAYPFIVENSNKSGELLIRKVDSEGKVIAGAVFRLLDIDGNVVDTQTSNELGEIKFENIKPGEYTLFELEAPPGYLLSPNIYEVSVNEEGEVKVLLDGMEISLNPLIIPNYKGEFPATGGIGTRLFTAIGLGLMLTSVVLRYYFGRKKKSTFQII